MTPIIEMRKVTKAYHGAPAIKDIDFDLRPGEIHGFPNWGQVVATEAVDTVRLDDVAETAGAEMLKIDIQGGELMAMRHAEARLRDMLVIHTEVEFLPMYVDQPLFSDVDQFLRNHASPQLRG